MRTVTSIEGVVSRYDWTNHPLRVSCNGRTDPISSIRTSPAIRRMLAGSQATQRS